MRKLVACVGTEGMLQRRTLKPTDFVDKVMHALCKEKNVFLSDTSSMEFVSAWILSRDYAIFNRGLSQIQSQG